MNLNSNNKKFWEDNNEFISGGAETGSWSPTCSRLPFASIADARYVKFGSVVICAFRGTFGTSTQSNIFIDGASLPFVPINNFIFGNARSQANNITCPLLATVSQSSNSNVWFGGITGSEMSGTDFSGVFIYMTES